MGKFIRTRTLLFIVFFVLSCVRIVMRDDSIWSIITDISAILIAFSSGYSLGRDTSEN